MPDTTEPRAALPPGKFRDPHVTASGEARASVTLTTLRTLWFNTGSLCNIACDNCYIESSPRNDTLAYLSVADVGSYLDEIEKMQPRVEEIGFTGGEPFLNRDFLTILEQTLARGYRVLVLTNGMKPMQRNRERLQGLLRHGDALRVRVSLDHYTREKHEEVRGPGSWEGALAGLRLLAKHQFRMCVGSRTLCQESEAAMRAGFHHLFAAEGLPIDAWDPQSLLLFPEMDLRADAPEITTRCWRVLGKRPEDMMCASSRMVIKRKGSAAPAVVPCTLLPYDPRFELGTRITDAAQTVALNHPFCAQFCVLGGASCSPR